jgi:hypothetical protein
VVGERFLDIGDFAAPTDVFIEFDGPQFDAVVPRFPRDADFIEKGSGFDRGGIERKAHISLAR